MRWLYLLTRLRLGACLADDMGLGKTIQMLALLLVLKRERRKPAAGLVRVCWWCRRRCSPTGRRRPSASRPSLRLLIAHPSAMPAAELRASRPRRARQPSTWSSPATARCCACRCCRRCTGASSSLDEAQAIKNPGAKQTRQVKKLQGRRAHRADRHAGGKPPVRSVVDLRLHPSRPAGFAARSSPTSPSGWPSAEHFGPLRDLVRPYILRRLKTDKRVIADLPDKTELKAWCHLSPAQAALYQRAVEGAGARAG